MKTPRGYAHVGCGLALIGFFVYLIMPTAYWISLAIWAVGVVTGVIAIAKNGRILPSISQLQGRDKGRLDLTGFIEVYVAILPGLAAAALIIYGVILRKIG